MRSDGGVVEGDVVQCDNGCLPHDFVAGWLGSNGASVLHSLATEVLPVEPGCVPLSSFLLAVGRKEGIYNRKLAPLRDVFLGLAASFAKLVDLSRCESELWSAPHRRLPELSGASKRRRVAMDLKLEITEVSAVARMSAHTMLSAVEAWQHSNVSGEPSVVVNKAKGREWTWGIMFNYMVIGQEPYRAGPRPVCIAYDEVTAAGDSNLFVANWCPVARVANWWPLQAVRYIS
jgi:hypothetical protein